MEKWALDEAFVAWLRTEMTTEQVSTLDLNGVLDDIYAGYLAGVAAERERLAPVMEAWRAVFAAARTVEGTGLGKVEIPAAVWVPFATVLRNAGRLTEEGKATPTDPPSRGNHFITYYQCGHVYAQCRCPGPKVQTTLDDACPQCEEGK